MDVDAVDREARRLLARYQVEVVEAFELCPWAASARRKGEVRVEILITPGAAPPDHAAIRAAVARIVEDPAAAMGMVVFAASTMAPGELRELRDVAARRDVAIADFHPDAPADVTTAARLVPGLRRAPDPMLQIVRWSVLEAARRPPSAPDRAAQLRILAGEHVPAAVDVADQITTTNHATITRVGLAALDDVVAELRRDRDQAYARAGVITASASPSP